MTGPILEPHVIGGTADAARRPGNAANKTPVKPTGDMAAPSEDGGRVGDREGNIDRGFGLSCGQISLGQVRNGGDRAPVKGHEAFRGRQGVEAGSGLARDG